MTSFYIEKCSHLVSDTQRSVYSTPMQQPPPVPDL